MSHDDKMGLTIYWYSKILLCVYYPVPDPVSRESYCSDMVGTEKCKCVLCLMIRYNKTALSASHNSIAGQSVMGKMGFHGLPYVQVKS